jgi:hypothetical protein
MILIRRREMERRKGLKEKWKERKKDWKTIR